LTVITGYLQLALGELGPSHPARHGSEQAMRAAEGAMELTRQLVSFSRRKAGQETVDLRYAIEQSESITGRSGVDNRPLDLSIEPECGSVYASQTRIDRIVATLVAGAREAFPESASLDLMACAIEIDSDFSRLTPGAEAGPYVVIYAGPPQMTRSDSAQHK